MKKKRGIIREDSAGESVLCNEIGVLPDLGQSIEAAIDSYEGSLFNSLRKLSSRNTGVRHLRCSYKSVML